MKVLNIRHESLKLLQERKWKKLENIGIGNNYLNRTLVGQQLRERIGKWDTTNETVTRLKGQPIE
jgi:hypothetical protein